MPPVDPVAAASEEEAESQRAMRLSHQDVKEPAEPRSAHPNSHRYLHRDLAETLFNPIPWPASSYQECFGTRVDVSLLGQEI